MTVSARTPSALAAALRDIQAPVRRELEAVPGEIRRIVTADVPLVQEVGDHLLGMKGKLFRPTLTLLSSAVDDKMQPRAITFAAVMELMHLATLIHDDAVDHSVLRRGMPTVNALFSHQISVIMGDFLYSRAMRELVQLEDLESDARRHRMRPNEMTLGEMRQLAAFDALAFTGSGLRTADSREDRGAVRGGVRCRRALRRAAASSRRWPATASDWAWRSRSPTTCSTTPRRRR